MIGYYTLSAGAVAFDHLPAGCRHKLPRYPLPVARIGELAVDRGWQGRGLGAVLLIDALQRIVHAAESMAVWAVVVDPIDTRASVFYQKYGFEPFLDDRALFLTMKDLRHWLNC